MKTTTLVVGTLLAFASSLAALDVPTPSGHVNDLAGMLDQQQVSSLEARLVEFEESTSNEIAILTIQSLERESLEGYSIRVAREWGVGKESKDNGVLILIAKEERKMRIEVGKGLEGVLTDYLAGVIIDRHMTPAFKQGQFFEGISTAVSMIEKVASGEYTEEQAKAESEKSSSVGPIIGASLFAMTVSAAFGPLGVVLCVVIGAFAGGMIGGLTGAIIGGILGLLIGLFIYTASQGGGGGGGYYGGSGGSYSGGGIGGGSFGGFGGGGFSGGGASGGW